MVKRHSTKQLSFSEFNHPFIGCGLSTENRWVKLAKILPWDKIEQDYLGSLSAETGAPSISSRIVIGALIIKHIENYSDERTIEMIRENPYMQYFCGLKEFTELPLFDPSLFVTLRKRIGREDYKRWLKYTLDNAGMGNTDRGDDDSQNHETTEKRDNKSAGSSVSVNDLPDHENKGSIKIDATVAPADIRFPTDVNLLNDARQKAEELIDTLYLQSTLVIKPRTYRQKAREDFISFIKRRKKQKNLVKRAVKKQLNYLRRDIEIIYMLLDELDQRQARWGLTRAQMKYLYVIQELYRQQRYMFHNQTHQIGHRIVSIHQPHVRPIVRGKAGKETEFGAKINVSLSEGLSVIEQFDWEAFNEGCFLVEVLDNYKKRKGCYPELVQVDSIYLTRENRHFMKENGIRHIGKALGRPTKEELTINQLRQRKAETAERNQIEGLFGVAKRRYMLERVRARLSSTSKSWISASFFVMNLLRLAKMPFLFVWILSYLRTVWSILCKKTSFISLNGTRRLTIFNGYNFRQALLRINTELLPSENCYI